MAPVWLARESFAGVAVLVRQLRGDSTMALIDGVTNADAMPVLEAAMSFAGKRHRLIAHNIANLSTPDFRPRDVDVGGFRETLAEAVADRRSRLGGQRGELDLKSTSQVKFDEQGHVASLEPGASGTNVLFHDRSNRDLERTMQDLVENVAAFRIAGELLRSRHDLINSAIRERQ